MRSKATSEANDAGATDGCAGRGVVAFRPTLDNDAWLAKKCAGKRRGYMSELVNLAVTEMRQGQEARRMRRKAEK